VTDEVRRTSPDLDCSLCTPHFALHLINSARAGLTQICQQAALAEIVADRCKWIDQHKQEMTGYLLARINPFKIGTQRAESYASIAFEVHVCAR
jgi:hypothetical protein